MMGKKRRGYIFFGELMCLVVSTIIWYLLILVWGWPAFLLFLLYAALIIYLTRPKPKRRAEETPANEPRNENSQ
jgi:membrane protein implicated in regulation of membrane protease activity